MKDDSLLSSMAARLRSVEEELRKKEDLIKEKEDQLHEMRVKLADAKRITGSAQSQENKDRTIIYLREECSRAQKQVQEMECFLAEYGMIWVGDESDDTGLDALSIDKEVNTMLAENWRPDQSVPTECQPNYNLIISNIQELNILGGEGVGVVMKGPDGVSRMRAPDPVPIALYENGLMLFDGPFRPYTEPYTQQIIEELQEGYFPSELQLKYPKGVPLKVKDLRETKYVDPRMVAHFPGKGHTMSEAGQELAMLRGLDINDIQGEEPQTHTSSNTSSKSMERFLKKLPSNVIRDGKILDIRGSIGAMIGVTGPQGSIEVAETHIVKQIQNGENNKESSPVTTLRVKMDTKTVIVKLNYNDTLQDLRAIIDERRDGSSRYEIRTTFPSKSYDDLGQTLQEADLVPNAILHIRNLE